MPTVQVNGFNMNYEKQGSGEPLVLIPFLTADNACYAFQFPVYSEHFTCFSIDPRGSGVSETTPGAYSTDMLADDAAAFMQAVGIEKAHVAGTSLGASTALKLAAKYPDKVKSVMSHSGWSKTDLFINILINGWVETAKAKGSVLDTALGYIFPWCLSSELFAYNADHIGALANFVKSRPVQSVEAFQSHCEAVLSHDIEGQLGSIKAPTLLTFGAIDAITSPGRFADKMKNGIPNSETVIFEGCAHAPMYEKTQEYNDKTLDFLKRHAG